MILNHTETMLFSLLRTALWEHPANTTLFISVTAEEWNKCMCLAIQHGVQAFVFDGAMTLPVSLQPPRKLKLAWAANVSGIEKNYERMQHAASRLKEFYESHGLKLMLMKGIGLAADYPIPRHRECGDLDIWLFGKYKEGNQFMTQQGIHIDLHNPKHSCFYFKGVLVENHCTFLNVKQFKTDRYLEMALQNTLSENTCGTLPLPGDNSLLLPPAMFSAIFLARHMCMHFVNGIVLRQLCDWALFLYKHHGEYDKEKLSVLLDDVGLLSVMQSFTLSAIEYLGLPPEYSPFPTSQNINLKERLFRDIMHPHYSTPPVNKNPFRIIAFKWKRLMANRWKYELIQKESFFRQLGKSMIFHLLHPNTILKMK